jgi:hypothetical protein
MKNIPSLLHRYRLMTSILALVLLLGALVVTPASADEEFVLEGVICENGCVGWNQGSGCVRCQRCCANSSNGQYACWTVDASLCG